ncbi:MAG: hypothetical protein H7A23_19640 [Leptospiraceae bacterium]|nr:hypothetical protein [Leptospiraceae bacterium]MCP5496769.1 hypothetical protein [Leptospiraceae bacterium]
MKKCLLNYKFILLFFIVNCATLFTKERFAISLESNIEGVFCTIRSDFEVVPVRVQIPSVIELKFDKHYELLCEKKGYQRKLIPIENNIKPITACNAYPCMGIPFYIDWYEYSFYEPKSNRIQIQLEKINP